MARLEWLERFGVILLAAVVMAVDVPALAQQTAQQPTQQPTAQPAQQPAATTTDPTIAQGDAHIAAKEWQQAAQVFAAIAQREPQNGSAFFRLGLSLMELKQYAQAVKMFQKSRELNFARMGSAYQGARGLAALGRTDNAFAWLDAAAQDGFNRVPAFMQEPLFASLIQDARYAGMLKKIQINAAPCEHLPEYRQFDFWIGDWEVHNGQGQKVGENRVSKLNAGCVLLGQWTGGPNSSGTSLNYYDHSRGTYVQRWITSDGGMIPAEGGVSEGAMRLNGVRLLRNGSQQLYRGTWTPLQDGRVRQLLELSSDEGKTWTVWFDIYHSRKQQAAPAQTQ